MRTKLRSKISLLFMTFGLLLAIPAVALADDIRDGLEDGAQSTQTITAGDSTSTGFTNQYWIVANSAGTSPTGCDVLAEGDSITATFQVNTPSGVTASASSLTFDECRAGSDLNSQTVKFTSNTPGTYTIPALTKTSGTGTYTTANTDFTLVVNDNCPSGDTSGNLQDGKCTANTAPQVSVGGVTDGASYNKGSVPNATCDVTDTEDGDSSSAATLSAITGPYASDGIGSQTASCSYTDGGGLKATASETYSIVDPTPPVIQKVVTGTLGNNDWYTSNVSVDWTVSDPESPNSLLLTGCNDQSITADQAATTYSCSATSAGGSATEESVTIKRDATAPTINHSLSPAATSFGWNNTAVLVDYSCSDATSGLASCGPDETLSSEGANQSSTGNATDNAGNSASDTVSNINIDLTNPLVALVGGPANGSSHYFGFVPSAPTCAASDALSGLDGACQVSGYGTTVGSHTVTATAKDKAANTNTASNSYTVLGWTLAGFKSPVDMGIYNDAKGGSTVPLKFEVFAGATELTSTNVVDYFTQKVNCASGEGDAIEQYSTGNTELRYDTTSGQFIFNWKTPKAPGSCYRVTLQTDDGSQIYADFRLK
jgi:hypothetical protein